MKPTRSEKTLKQLDKQQGNGNKALNQDSNVEHDFRLRSRKTQPKRDRGEMDAQKPGHVSLEVKVSRKRAILVKETPKKRLKMSKSTDAAKSINVSVESNSGNRKRKASTEEEKPSKKRRDSKLQETPSSSSDEEPEDARFKAHTNRDNYEEKYLKLHEIGRGGFGFVYAGIRKADFLPVAIKCILMIDQDHAPELSKIPREVALMERAGGGPESVGKHAAVSLLDWYYLDDELIIVMERPDSSMNMTMYTLTNGAFDEQKTKIFMAQLVEAALDIQNRGVLHNDIKMANILVECGSSIPRLRVIDFGCGSFIQKKWIRSYNGTRALAPPEWITHKKYRAEPTTVWQLGALMYRMLHDRLFDTLSYITGQLRISDKLSMGCIDFLKLCFASYGKRGTLEQLRLHPWLQ
ncbi:serine/threonine-protein kinase pim-2-like [Notolabrus celidotus]|uniref:serine/threonine-protein kinase pim-2-like n=1 Tax=Notolabrus celidotus TaxID=1203425 RepID=UPI0014900BDD|nr:serine/threonine-protein kinase pim-2-like [Notolabrus celidotus]